MTAQPNAKQLAAKGPGSDEPFTFTTTQTDGDGNPITITVPSCSVAPQPPPLVINEIVDEFEDQRAQAKVQRLLLQTAVGDEAYAVIRQFGSQELKTFNDEWQKHSGVGLGEYKAS